MSSPLPPIPVQQLAAIGPYFKLDATGVGRGWRPASALIEDAGHLGQVIDDVAARLGTAQRWIAASIFSGSAVVCGAVPDLSAALVWYRPRRSGPIGLSVVPPQPLSPDAGWRHLHDRHLVPLAAAIRGQVRIGGYLLRGNAASALAGALGVLAQARQEPLDALIGHGWAQPADIAPCGRWLPAPGGPRYARATCCGYEQLDQGDRCGDCSLNWRRPLRPAGGQRG
jgi:hypothetical protein